jgi:hypothetical protein
MPAKAKKRAFTPTSMQQPLQQTTASKRRTTEPPKAKPATKNKEHVKSEKKTTKAKTKNKPAPKKKRPAPTAPSVLRGG